MNKVVCYICKDDFPPMFKEKVIPGEVFRGTFDECSSFLEEMLHTDPLDAMWERYSDVKISMGEAYDGPCDIQWSTITYTVEEV